MKLGMKRPEVSSSAKQQHAADVKLSDSRPSLLTTAGEAEARFRDAQARRAPVSEQHKLAVALDEALTAAMQAAYAAQRAEIGPRGYDDRIFRRKAMAKPAVHKLTGEAEHLLTLRETHRLNDIPAEPVEPAV
jgi:hypothetical protein